MGRWTELARAAFDRQTEKDTLIEQLRREKAEAVSLLEQKAEELKEKSMLAEKLQAISEMTYWAELSSGATIKEGDRVRYFGKTYDCIQSHTKALLRAPINAEYWKEVIL